MKIWKIILATVVIFAAGAFAGGLFVKSRIPTAVPAKPPVPPILSQERFQARLKKELALEGEQTNRIDKIFSESNARIKILWGLLGPEMERERKEVYEAIRAELNPTQREKFEELLKQRPRRGDGSSRRLHGTNQPGGAPVPAPEQK